jgi:guanylate kinase
MRLSRAEEELSFAPQFDTVIINDDLELAKKQVVQKVKRFMGL